MAFLLNSSHIYFVWSISRFSTTRAIDFQPRTLGRQCEFTRAHDSRTNACKVVDRLAVHWWQSRQNSNNNEDIENYAKTKEHTVNIIKISSNALPLIDLVISGVETYITQLCCCYYYCYYIILSLSERLNVCSAQNFTYTLLLSCNSFLFILWFYINFFFRSRLCLLSYFIRLTNNKSSMKWIFIFLLLFACLLFQLIFFFCFGALFYFCLFLSKCSISLPRVSIT